MKLKNHSNAEKKLLKPIVILPKFVAY